MVIQSPSSSSSFSNRFKYQVFISFRGQDTRYNVAGNLYNALTKMGIHTFFDEYDLEGGDEITPSLFEAIEDSRILIPVFSIHYASSSFCLKELAHIMKCYKTKNRLVIPIFYDVDPTHVRHQTGTYGEDLAEHEERFQGNEENMERLQIWKVALKDAANLSGEHFRSCNPTYQYEFIDKIAKYISNKINRVLLHVAKHPIGLESRVQHVMMLLLDDDGSSDRTHMVGLYGMGGLGKSTLAKAVYNFIAHQFDGSCYLENVRVNLDPKYLEHLQEKLLLKIIGNEIKVGSVSEGIMLIKERLQRKKILLILDNIDKIEQLDALAGELAWFGPGSRVIVTTRDKQLLTSNGIKRTYDVKGLHKTKALELLKWMAFKNMEVPTCYEDILKRVVTYASGIPLVIEIKDLYTLKWY
ncbi:disease resistance protein RPV1 [Trifolium repens]|nr:disease resistance protein RPV1 [Trifolium repens]